MNRQLYFDNVFKILLTFCQPEDIITQAWMKRTERSARVDGEKEKRRKVKESSAYLGQ